MMPFNPPELHRGQLFVFEGIDRCGKSTQCTKLKDSLEKDGRNVEIYTFPNRKTEIGLVINKYLQKEIDLPDPSIHLLFSANRWESMKEIQLMLQSGTTIIMDRYAYSGICYSVAKGALSLSWCKSPDRGIIKPDCIFYLDLSAQSARQRSGYGEERYEVVEFQEKVREQFTKLMDNTWKVINAEMSEENIAAEIYDHAVRVNNRKLKRLWIDDPHVPCDACVKA